MITKRIYEMTILLIVLGITLVLGRYTGYRLLELWRFRGLLREADKP